jgi:acetyl esterase/lipase
MPDGNQTGGHDVRVVPDLVFTAPDGKPLLADLYLPANPETTPPVILSLHGGAWRVGDRRLAPDLKRFFAARGFAMASIEYRLTGEAMFPAQIHDVKTAIRWLRSLRFQCRADRLVGLIGRRSSGGARRRRRAGAGTAGAR